jgi:hypothetical protein
VSAPGRLDPAPALAQARLALLDADRPATVANVAAVLGCEARTVHRYMTGARMHAPTADRVAVRLGLHPLNLWPHYHDRTP